MPSKHFEMLQQILAEDAPYSKIFHYGAQFLPKLRDPLTGKINLDLLEGYTPEVVRYFDTVADMPSLPGKLQDLAMTLAGYADGETVQIDSDYFSLDPDLEIEKALKEVSNLVERN